MATKKNFIYLDLGGGGEKVNPVSTPEHFEFEESDIWNLSGVVSNEPKRSVFGSRAPKKIIKRNDHGPGRAVAATSLPVKVPDWSKILRGEYKNLRIDQNDDDEDINGNDEDDDRIPPHEYLARTRIASFSVHEGIGRTLKGRDLRRRMGEGRRPILIGLGVVMVIGIAVYLRLWTIDYRISSDDTQLIRRQFDLANREAMDESAEWRLKYDQEVDKATKCANELIQIKESFQKKVKDAASNTKKLEMLQKENIGLLERVETLKQELESEKLKCSIRQI